MIHDPSSDEELALQIQRGDREALTLLVERYHGPILGFLYRMSGGDRSLAEDLVQETFLRALRSIGQYLHPRPFKPWLYAIALNLARDHYKQAEMRHVDTILDVFEPSFDDPPDARLQAGEEVRSVAAAVSKLPKRQREAVILRYYQGQSLAEIAEVLQVPVGTVKSRISLGLRRLRECLEELENER
jgi:RNA polymerase sigma-70 factor (ECF subfamily)